MDIPETEIGDEAVSLLQMSTKRRWAVTSGVMTGIFIAGLEMTVVGTAMPTVVASVGGLKHFSWVFSSYLLASTVTVPLWGKLSDLYGLRLCYQIGLAIFLLGSVLSGLSTSMPQLVVFRAVQGIGAGALLPLSLTVVAVIFTLRERARMQAFFSGTWGLASIIGPLVGGFLTDHLSWRWVFYINVPFGLLSAAIIGIALKEPQRTKRPVIDYAGAAALTAAITMLMFFLVEGSGTVAAFIRTQSLALLAGAILLMWMFLRIERKAVEPIVPLELFKNRTVTVSVIATFLAGVAMFGAISFVPLFAQGAMGATATTAGSLLTPLLLGWVTFATIGGRLLLKVGYRQMAIAGCLFFTIGFTVLSTFGRTPLRIWLIVDVTIIGAGLGLTMLTLMIAVQHAVPREQLGIATSLNQFARSVGGA
jgi:EmrB/QacA subfamily drug resistance transporter